VSTDNFSVRWTGTHSFEAGDYTFTARSDDGIRVWVDGELIIDQWKDQPATTYNATRTMTPGEHQVKVEYYEKAEAAVAEVSWQAVKTPVNQAPIATINKPDPALKWKVGDVIEFSGSATDPEDGSIPPSGLSWKIILHHCPGGQCHDHPFSTASGASGNFTAPDHGDESYFEIVLTATDSGGKTATKSINIHPQTVQITLATRPDGLQVVYDGTSGKAPLSRTTVVGSKWKFKSWSDGGAQQHNVRIGANNTTYTATFGAGKK
jgi:PA14 domain